MFLFLTPSCLALDLQEGFIQNIEEIWIDFNKNGVLRLMNKYLDHLLVVLIFKYLHSTYYCTIRSNSYEVSMKYNLLKLPARHGEVEDYTVNIGTAACRICSYSNWTFFGNEDSISDIVMVSHN
jgi:hypothetical protein